ncbi:TPA: hypothetical protein ACG3R3_001311 [Clostridioides difficile]|nr:hypothetical protein [Clostridioides difficile]HBF5147653.1 hypothetical protein [Clostridioides difficile]HBH3651428.1 hypothetical protein [Clostridioides difficile]HBH3691503.1 hypothetical protein [Clostridioides difficile]HDO9657080.1 hypothetical protein [Clostridioides difficile]
MALKGSATIELTDSQGNKEVYKEDNIITNAVQDLLNINLNGQVIPFKFFPLKDFFSGVLLMDSNIEERPDITTIPSGVEVLGHAGSETNTTTNALKGSINLTETKELNNGYKFVWDFSNTQGNGIIKSICLTHLKAGNDNLYNNIVTDVSTYDSDKYWSNDVKYITSIDFENGILYVCEKGSSTTDITIYKYSHNFLSFGINDIYSNIKLIETKVISGTTIGAIKSELSFSDGRDGYLYGFYAPRKASGDTILNIIRISKSDFTYTEKSITLTDVQLYLPNDFYYVNVCPIKDGFIYLLDYKTKSTFYKMNLTDETDIKLLESDNKKQLISSEGSSFALIGDTLYSKYVTIFNDKVREISKNLIGDAYCIHSYKNYLIRFYSYSVIGYLNGILTTVNNLSTPIEKTTDKTMKITYIITEA